MKYVLLFGFLINSALANEHAHHGGASDLIAPIVNVLILLGFLAYKLKGPATKHFQEMSGNISNTIERAFIKSKEAQVMLDLQTKKITNLKSEIDSLRVTAEKDIKNFENQYSKEVEEKTHRLKADANNKIEAEKKILLNELSNELVDVLIKETKTKIKADNNLRNKASEKLLAGNIK